MTLRKLPKGWGFAPYTPMGVLVSTSSETDIDSSFVRMRGVKLPYPLVQAVTTRVDVDGRDDLGSLFIGRMC